MIRAKPISLWDTTSEEQDYQAPLDMPSTDVDVAIVGGGFTGLSTLLHASNLGLSAHVLEAEHIGFGGSGRNVGLVNAGTWLPPQDVLKVLGENYGTRFVKTFGDGPSLVFDLIEQYQIRCEATKTGTIHAAHSPKGFEDLRARHREWQRLGEPVDLLHRNEIQNLLGTSAYYGGLVDHRAGTINPMGYCRGLARAALGAGGKISTGVRATRLLRENNMWIVETDKGSVRAKSVVLGTNAYTDKLWPGLKEIFTMVYYFQFATKPMGEEAAHILPNRQGLWDTGPIMFNIRRDQFDRLLIGSMGKVIGDKDSGLSARFARKQIAKIFTELSDVSFEEAWHGQIAMTPDHLPKIFQLEEGLFTPIGYNGRGITTGTIFGKAMADVVSGVPTESLPLPISKTLTSVRGSAMISRLYNFAFMANQLCKAV